MHQLASTVQHLHRHFPFLTVPRCAESHKGSYGNVMLIGATEGMNGAIVLASAAALLMGCGKSYAVFCQQYLPMAVLPSYPEVILKTAQQQLTAPEVPSVIAIGCGMGISDATTDILEKTLDFCHQHTIPLLLDAGALTIIANNETIADVLAHNRSKTILTPHPGEAARLLHCSTAEVQQNRIAAAQQIATRFNSQVVLKGHQSIIAESNGNYVINNSGNAGLATAGSGDVLTGMLAGLLAQHISEKNIISAGVWLHGAAADILGNGIALTGLLAGEIAPAVRKLRHLAMQENISRQ